MTDADRDNLIARAKQLGELSHSLLTAAHTRDDAMLSRVADQLDAIRDDIWIATFGKCPEPSKPEPKPQPQPQKQRWWEGADPSATPFTMDYEAFEKIIRKMRSESWQSRRRPFHPRPAAPQGSGETLVRRLVDLLGTHYQSGATTAEMVRAAQRATHPDTPGGSAERFKEVTEIAQALGVLDRRGQYVG